MTTPGKSWYMHTIDGRPAHFIPSQGTVCFIGRRTNAPVLVPNLATIRKQQRIAMRADCTLGLEFDYDYVTFPRKAGR